LSTIAAPCPSGDGLREQLLHLGAHQRPPFAFAQRAIRQRADVRAAQREHVETDRGEHAPHFAVLAFVQRDREQRPFVGALEHFDEGRCGAAFGQAHALLHALDRLAVDAAAQLDQVGLGDAVARVRHAVAEVAVVGEQDQAGRILVEPTDGVDAPALGIVDQIDRARARLAPIVGAQHAARLVQQVVAVARGLGLEHHAVDLDALGARIDLGAELGHDALVDRHLAGGDQLVALAPRSDAVVGQVLVQTHQTRLAAAGGLDFGRHWGGTR
jgi:hypothetical protein